MNEFSFLPDFFKIPGTMEKASSGPNNVAKATVALSVVSILILGAVLTMLSIQLDEAHERLQNRMGSFKVGD